MDGAETQHRQTHQQQQHQKAQRHPPAAIFFWIIRSSTDYIYCQLLWFFIIIAYTLLTFSLFFFKYDFDADFVFKKYLSLLFAAVNVDALREEILRLCSSAQQNFSLKRRRLSFWPFLQFDILSKRIRSISKMRLRNEIFSCFELLVVQRRPTTPRIYVEHERIRNISASGNTAEHFSHKFLYVS